MRLAASLDARPLRTEALASHKLTLLSLASPSLGDGACYSLWGSAARLSLIPLSDGGRGGSLPPFWPPLIYDN